MDRSALARCVGDVDAFATEHWGRRPMLRRGAGSFADLFSLDAIEHLLHLGLRRPAFRLVRDGLTLPAGECTSPRRIGGVVVDDVADAGAVIRLVGAGATLVVQSLQHQWAPLATFCAHLAEATSHPVQANAYLTPTGAAALRPHEDRHEVLALQLEGAKRWDVDGLGPVTIEAGDVLYLPAGTRHSAQAVAGAHSLHLTVGVLAVTYGHVVRRLLAELGELERPLPLGFAADRAGALDGALAAVLGAVAERASTADVSALASTERARARGRLVADRRGTLRAVLDPDALHDGVVLRRLTGAPLAVADGGEGTVTLDAGPVRLRLPARTRDALAVVAARERVLVGELAGLGPAGRIVLARRLLREGIVAVEAPGSSPGGSSRSASRRQGATIAAAARRSVTSAARTSAARSSARSTADG